MDREQAGGASRAGHSVSSGAGRGLGLGPSVGCSGQCVEGPGVDCLCPAGLGSAKVTSLGASAGWGHTGSVVLEEGEQVIIAVSGEVGGAQVGQQLIRVGELREQVQSWFWGLPWPGHVGGPHHACGRIEG